MTGPEHYREAENFLIRGERATDGGATFFAAAQAHATLALAAATAEPIAQAYDGPDDTSIPAAWSAAIS